MKDENFFEERTQDGREKGRMAGREEEGISDREKGTKMYHLTSDIRVLSSILLGMPLPEIIKFLGLPESSEYHNFNTKKYQRESKTSKSQRVIHK